MSRRLCLTSVVPSAKRVVRSPPARAAALGMVASAIVSVLPSAWVS